MSVPGRLIEGALRYDLKLWARSRGRAGAFHRELFERARLAEGDSVLDVGCGTGTVAIAAKRRVGPSGAVHGIDPSAEMIARARKKALRAGLEVSFENGVAQELRFPDASFDVVLATLMLHHLPPDARQKALVELRRVIGPGGRLLAVDIDLGHPDNPRHGPHAHAHRAGASFDLDSIGMLMAHLGLHVVDTGLVAFRFARFERMRYVLAERS